MMKLSMPMEVFTLSIERERDIYAGSLVFRANWREQMYIKYVINDRVFVNSLRALHLSSLTHSLLSSFRKRC